MDIIGMHTGNPVVVHDPRRCAGTACCIHNPSRHRLSQAPLDWYQDIGMMMRVCEHGRHHPDPDDLEYHRRRCRFLVVEAVSSVHLDRCDGCCRG